MFSEPKNAVTTKFDAFKASVNNKNGEPRSIGRVEPGPHSVIGRELTIAGNITSTGTLALDGHIEGDVHCEQLRIGKEGRIDGVVIAEDVVVDGRIKGDLRGAQVTLKANAHVDGDIFHSSLAIEQGAFFVGRSQSCDNPAEAKMRSKATKRNKAPADKGANGHDANGKNGSPSAATLSLSKDDVIKSPGAAARKSQSLKVVADPA